VGSDVQVTGNDAFYIGSCTKAMTSTLMAVLVEQGKLQWDTTLKEALPDLAYEMHQEIREVTIKQLLCHYAGLPTYGGEFPQGKTIDDMIKLPGTLPEQRKEYVRMMLKQGPQITPGERYSYSNVGYAVAGVIAEEIMDTPWEELMEEMIFQPLGMTNTDFGIMCDLEKIDQPWQHVFKDGEHIAIEPVSSKSNPHIIGPAGSTVRCSIGDWAKFVIAHLQGVRGEQTPLAVTDFDVLHTPPFGGDYAMGWVGTERDWGGGRVLWHSGSNGLNYAVVWMAPLLDFGVLVATNQGGDDAYKACDETAGKLIKYFQFKNITKLENLNWDPKWHAMVGCIKGCLNYLNIKISDAWLYGATGYAFILNMHENVIPFSVGRWNKEMVYTLGENLGYKTEHVWSNNPPGDFQTKQKLAWDKVREAIDNGYPCYGFPLHSIPEFYVIFGYDENGYYYKGVECELGNGPKLWQDIGKSNNDYFEIHFIKPSEQSSDHKTVKDALQFAIDHSKSPEKWINPEYKSGPAGYDLWINALQQGKADGFGTAFNAAVWAECRGYAVPFLKEAKTRLSPELYSYFDQAITHYETASANLSKVSEVFPCFSASAAQRDANVKDKDRCQQAIEYLITARDADQAGLKVLEQIVEKL
jgi:CubicO group peptidase (beta-lactamase class C family)